MKKLLLNFAENFISKEQMSKVKGGGGGGSECYIKCYNEGGTHLGTISGGSDCVGGDDCCREKYKTFDHATCTCY